MFSYKTKIFACLLVVLALSTEYALAATIGYNPAECRRFESGEQK